MEPDDLPAWHPEGFHLDRSWWTWARVLDLAEVEVEWVRHVDALCDHWDAIEDGPRSGFAGSWLETSQTLEAVRNFPPSMWWGARDGN